MSTPVHELSPISKFIFSFISRLDSIGAETWDLRAVAITSAVIFLSFKLLGEKNNVFWEALVHSIVIGIGSGFVVYVNWYDAVAMTGMSEPLRSLQCKGPFTSLHRIIPAITQGYALCDIINGYNIGPAFLAHGICTFLVTTIFAMDPNSSSVLTPVLTMEISSIFLAVLRADFMTPTMKFWDQILFSFTFFLCRILLAPYLCFTTLKIWKDLKDDGDLCLPEYLFYVCAVFSAFFNCLNMYWFIKILKKMHRKVTKVESMSNVVQEGT